VVLQAPASLSSEREAVHRHLDRTKFFLISEQFIKEQREKQYDAYVIYRN